MNDLQINRLSEIIGNLSLLLFASFVLPIFGSQITNIETLIFGGVASALSFGSSLLLLKGGGK